MRVDWELLNCKLELPRYVPIDGKRIKVCVVKLSDISA